jgi:hypothetical protein
MLKNFKLFSKKNLKKYLNTNFMKRTFSITKRCNAILSNNKPEVDKSQNQISKTYPIIDHTYDASFFFS